MLGVRNWRTRQHTSASPRRQSAAGNWAISRCCSAWVAASFGLTVTLGGGVRYLARFIEDCDLDTLLTRPRSVLVHALGMRAQPSGFGDLISGSVFMALSRQISWRTVPIVMVVGLRRYASGSRFSTFG